MPFTLEPVPPKDTPESVRKIAACVPFIDTNGGVNETQEALERYADLLERISKAPVATLLPRSHKAAYDWIAHGDEDTASQMEGLTGKHVALVEVE